MCSFVSSFFVGAWCFCFQYSNKYRYLLSFYGWIFYVHTHIPHFVHPFTSWWIIGLLWLFWLLWIKVLCTFLHISLCVYLPSFLLSREVGRRVTESYDNFCFTFWETGKLLAAMCSCQHCLSVQVLPPLPSLAIFSLYLIIVWWV